MDGSPIRIPEFYAHSAQQFARRQKGLEDEVQNRAVEARRKFGSKGLGQGQKKAFQQLLAIGEGLDLFENGRPIGITDISATCHMPDVIEAPYRPAMLGERPDGMPTRLGGPSCLAGDVIGDYRLPGDAHIGQRFAFLDQAHYSMVKTNTFNGVPLPSIWLWDSESDDL